MSIDCLTLKSYGLVFPSTEHQTDPTVNELSTMNDWIFEEP